MLGWALAASLLAVAPPPAPTSPPRFEIGADFEPAGPLAREARAGWAELASTWRAITDTPPPHVVAIRVMRGAHLPPDRAGASRVGTVELRQNQPSTLTSNMVVALRHELAHQFLWAACPAAGDDALFHEAFALATSGELSAWDAGPYLSMQAARRQLASARSLDSRRARAALARLLVNGPRDHGLPRVLAQRLRRCADRARWAPLTFDDLTDIAVAQGDAMVVLSRHSGEVLAAAGDVRQPLPFGSTLKPFMAAGARGVGPSLPVDSSRAEWQCGAGLSSSMDLHTALLRSCNGYFLDWAARDPRVAELGAYGPVLRALGLGHLPAGGPEATGLRPTLELSPLALAQAYRVLADASPTVLAMLQDNAARGTLSELPASARLRGVALKTGTVRDADSRAVLGLIAAVDANVIVVITRHGQPPRSFASALADVLDRFRPQRVQQAVRVQVLGLVPPEAVSARCEGLALVASAKGPLQLHAQTFTPLAPLVAHGRAMCLGAPWLLRYPGGPRAGAQYAGTFTWDPPPPYHVPPGVPAPTLRERRARQGSPFIFQTRLGAYVAGVLAAEDAQIVGEPRRALAVAVAHNAFAHRHPGRPVCDTTHCQAFAGTAAPHPNDEAALDESDPAPSGWLPFSQGGDAPWSERRSLAQVTHTLGAHPLTMAFAHGQVRFTVRTVSGDAVYEDRAALPCERLRGPLHLPSCPDSVKLQGNVAEFRGHGRGHGLGLDVDQAKQGGLDHRALLRQAYGSRR